MSDYADCYNVLGITSGADRTAVRRAYAQLAKIHRPDNDPIKFQQLRFAYERALALLEVPQTESIGDKPSQDQPSLKASTQDVFSPHPQADFSAVSWPEFLSGKHFSNYAKPDFSKQRADIAKFKATISQQIQFGHEAQEIQNTAQAMLSSDALESIEMRLDVEQWLINLGSNERAIPSNFFLWIAEKTGLLEDIHASNQTPEKQAFLAKLADLQSIERVKNIAATDRKSIESMILNGAGYIQLIRHVFKIRSGLAESERHRFDALIQWLETQRDVHGSLIDEPTVTRWRKLHSLPVVATLTKLTTITPTTSLVVLAVVLASMIDMLPKTFSVVRSAVWIFLIVASFPLLNLTTKLVNKTAQTTRSFVGNLNTPAFGLVEIGLALCSLACLSFYKTHPFIVFYLGLTLAFLTLVQGRINGILADHAAIGFSKIWAVALSFLLLMWLCYVGVGGLANFQHPLGFPGMIPALFSAGAALYCVFWPTAAISRDNHQQLYLRGKRLKHPKAIWLWLVVFYLNLSGLSASFVGPANSSASMAAITNLWLFYLTISVIGTQAIKQSNAVLVYLFFLSFGAGFMEGNAGGVLPGSFAISIINCATVVMAIWQTYTAPWLRAKNWVKPKSG
jgi:hypothetical protein